MDIPIVHYDANGDIDIDVVGVAVDENQLRTVHEPRGWRRAPADIAYAFEVLGVRTVDLTTLTKPELLTLAVNAGVEVDEDADEAAIAEALHDAPEGTLVAPAPTAVDSIDGFDIEATVTELTDYVGEDATRAAAVLAAEQEKGEGARKSLVDRLEAIVARAPEEA